MPSNPAIPEGQCAAVSASSFNQTAGSGEIDRFTIQNLDSTTVATSAFPSSASGWNVSGTASEPTVCAPTGSKRGPQYLVYVRLGAGKNPGDSVPGFRGPFTVTDALATCAKPAPPVFGAKAEGSSIKLTGTG